MAISLPALPVLLKLLGRNPLVVPPVPVPIVASVVSSPTWVDIKIKPGHMGIIPPPPVIIPGAIPPTFPRTPPPSIPEEQVDRDVGSDVHTVRLRHRYHRGRGRKDDGGRQGNANTYIYRCHRWNRTAKDQRHKDCSTKSLSHAVASFSTLLGSVGSGQTICRQKSGEAYILFHSSTCRNGSAPSASRRNRPSRSARHKQRIRCG